MVIYYSYKTYANRINEEIVIKEDIADDFLLIPIDDNSEYACKYYFDEKGDFITDNLSKDWTILDENAREIDSDLNPILYYIGVNNYLNNFNKISGKEDMESIVSSDRSTRCELIIYDKYKYDKGNTNEYLYYDDSFNYTGIVSFSFTFDRSIKNIIFVLNIDGKNKNRNTYFKDLLFGFSKSSYKEEFWKMNDPFKNGNESPNLPTIKLLTKIKEM